ncbi:hypothetical protein CAPTEDRAFT_163248 [Capitella teleta]|uniref:ATP-dependent DNA helicase II subunit 2 n=1 Tax=Capitella teleta TaxID=283909 RepID=R7UQ52_CAPTE|nr:hypothetical protein CAPTEDRAFT_163248 [Capitella teleta]|eukprot:ELU08335.1 hypothetical protein CAPTEDRAFT_163248 [Capitella teleta]
MAANKEAIAIVLDVGPGMNQAPPGCTTPIEESITAIQMILQRKLFSESKDEVALILLGTPNTANELADDDGNYANITLAKPIGPVDWQLLQYVQNDIHPSSFSADFISAVVVAMDHIVKGTSGKKGFASKRIILFSNLCGEFGDDHLDNIVGSLKGQDIEFDVIGPEMDDDDDDDGDNPRPGTSGQNQKPKSTQQRAGEALVKFIQETVEGCSYSFREALAALSNYLSRQVRSTAWRCNMEIGSELKIPINLFTRIKEAKAKSFKNVYARDPNAALERNRAHHLNDAEETEIEREDTVDGHRYGSTLVPFSADDKEAMKYRSEKCFKVFGFTKSENVRTHYKMGDATWVCVAEKSDEAAAVALSAFINALYETNCVAIVRRVYNNNGAVRIGALVPQIEAENECLIYNELPFAEDVRNYSFGSLPVSETNSANQRQAPTDDQLSLMDELIDNMDLSKVETDDDCQVLDPEVTFNPYLQRLFQCLQHRALNPDDPLPDLSEVVRRSLEPPVCVATQCESTVEKMKEKYSLQRVEKKKKETAENIFGKKDEDEEPACKKMKSEDDLNGGLEDIVKAKVEEVGTVNPVEDFKALLAWKDKDMFEEACAMMKARVLQLVSDSFGTQLYPKAMNCIQTFRLEAIKAAEPRTFNNFLRELKDILREKGRSDFWDDLLKVKVTLISKLESEDSSVGQEEAQRFLSEEDEKKEEKMEEEEEDEEDLFAAME